MASMRPKSQVEETDDDDDDDDDDDEDDDDDDEVVYATPRIFCFFILTLI